MNNIKNNKQYKKQYTYIYKQYDQQNPISKTRNNTLNKKILVNNEQQTVNNSTQCLQMIVNNIFKKQ